MRRKELEIELLEKKKIEAKRKLAQQKKLKEEKKEKEIAQRKSEYFQKLEKIAPPKSETDLFQKKEIRKIKIIDEKSIKGEKKKK